MQEAIQIFHNAVFQIFLLFLQKLIFKRKMANLSVNVRRVFEVDLSANQVAATLLIGIVTLHGKGLQRNVWKKKKPPCKSQIYPMLIPDVRGEI